MPIPLRSLRHARSMPERSIRSGQEKWERDWASSSTLFVAGPLSHLKTVVCPRLFEFGAGDGDAAFQACSRALQRILP